MKALLIKKWGTHYAGQVLTNVEKGSVPADVAKFYEDDEPTPMDVVVDHTHTVGDPLGVINDELDPKRADEVAKDKSEQVKRAARSGPGPAGAAEAAAELDREAAERRAKEANDFAAARLKGADGARGLTEGQKKKSQAGKEHGVKAGDVKGSGAKKAKKG